MKMKRFIRSVATYSCVLALSTAAYATPQSLLEDYQNQGAGPFSAEAGAAVWKQKNAAQSAPLNRSCSDCHGTDLLQTGRHLKTGKAIKPMSPASNSARLSDPKKVEKWFRRNCRWTLGRECTPQEKGDFISFINQK